MDECRQTYTGRDVAFLIPTKDRPEKLKNLLESLARQTEPCGRVVIVDGGQSVRDIVVGFSDRLPVEYYECRPAGQIRQRNMGIALLGDRKRLIGLLDDDIVLEREALEAMVSFWNKCESNTAGVSFNIINSPPERRSWLKCLFGLSAREQGRVLRSGTTTSNSHVPDNLRTQWLCGGLTVWKQEILGKFPHREISSRWAIAEDVIFSYPIGKKFPLYVCADARARHEHEMDYVSEKKYRFHGRTQTMWLFYFVESNKDLSKMLLLWTLLLRINGKCVLSILTLDKRHLEFAIGQLEGTIKALTVLISGKDISTILTEDSNRDRV